MFISATLTRVDNRASACYSSVGSTECGRTNNSPGSDHPPSINFPTVASYASNWINLDCLHIKRSQTKYVGCLDYVKIITNFILLQRPTTTGRTNWIGKTIRRGRWMLVGWG